MTSISSLKNYRQKYINLLNLSTRNNAEKKKALLAFEKEHLESLASLKNDLRTAKKQYFVEKLGSASLYLDRLEDGSTTISFDAPYTITPFTEKRSVIVGYYKNGKPRTNLKNFGFVNVSSSSSTITIQIGTTLTEARQFASALESKILSGQPLKNELDQTIQDINSKIAALKSNHSTATEKLAADYDKRKKSYDTKLEKHLASGSVAELNYLFRPARIVLLIACIFIGLPLIISSLAGYLHTIRFATESNFNYSIDAPEDLIYDCHLTYSDDHAFHCQEISYTGTVKMTENSKLLAGSLELTRDNTFTRRLGLIIPADAWAVENPNFTQIAEQYGNYTDQLTIYNDYTRHVVADRIVNISWRFSKDDLDLLQKTWASWQKDQQEQAKQRLEAVKKAEAEAKAKAEQEAREKAEAEAKAAAEKAAAEAAKAEEARRAEEAARQAETEANSYTPPASSSDNSSSSSSGSSESSSSGSGYSADETYIEGYCKDGTKVVGNPHAKGKANVCYGHKGWVGN
ncbi:hypothetical protein IKE83_00080 [Candidatus Saccharibacteria bacterium]|nr:hypothetical protein [Candidatus Saccharibacteria bacterium]